MTCPHQEYASYPGVPVNMNRYDAESEDPQPEKILSQQGLNSNPVLYVLWIIQNDLCSHPLDSSDLHVIPQNKDK